MSENDRKNQSEQYARTESNSISSIHSLDPPSSSTFARFTRNATWIDVNDADFQRWLKRLPRTRAYELEQNYRRLERTNRGTHLGGHGDKTLLRRQDDWYHCQAIAGQLDMKCYECETVCEEFDNHIDMRSYKGYGKQRKWPLVVFCLCALIHNESQPDKKWQYYPGTKYEKRMTYAGTVWRQYEGQTDRHELFLSFAQTHGFTDAEIQSCMEKIRRDVPRFRRAS